jgi:hypothetical protein
VSAPSEVVWRLDGLLLDALSTLGAPFERVAAGAYAVTLHGRRRASTVVWLIAGEQALAVEAFVMHVIEPDAAAVARLHRHLLGRNLRLRGVHFGLDDVGDVFLTGSLPTAGVDEVGVDRLLGEVLQLLEDEQDTLIAAAYGDRLQGDPALAAKVLADGAGRRPAGTPDWAPHRDVRR